MAQGAVEVLLALPSMTMAPPIQMINEIGREVDTSPLTLPSSSVQSQTNQQGVSAKRVECDAMDTGGMLSVTHNIRNIILKQKKQQWHLTRWL